jgi:hypothetical protein
MSPNPLAPGAEPYERWWCSRYNHVSPSATGSNALPAALMEPQLISLSVSPYTRRVRVTLAVTLTGGQAYYVSPAVLCALARKRPRSHTVYTRMLQRLLLPVQARWALERARCKFKIINYTPLFSEPWLRLQLGDWRGRLTLPVMLLGSKEGDPLGASATAAGALATRHHTQAPHAPATSLCSCRRAAGQLRHCGVGQRPPCGGRPGPVPGRAQAGHPPVRARSGLTLLSVSTWLRDQRSRHVEAARA